MGRKKKLSIVAVVLAVGLGLSWPFRKTSPEAPQQLERGELPVAATTTPPHQNATSGLASPRPTTKSPVSTTPHDVFQQAPGRVPATTSFDLAHHPVLAKSSVANSAPVTPTPSPASAFPQPPSAAGAQARPAYETIEHETTAAWPREVVHIVQDGDTLAKLAERYLGDAGRALEIFDMNRQCLANPHQLPIEAELRIPVAPGRMLD